MVLSGLTICVLSVYVPKFEQLIKGVKNTFLYLGGRSTVTHTIVRPAQPLVGSIFRINRPLRFFNK